MPLAGIVARVIAIEPSGAMREVLGAAIAESGRTNIDVRDARWPDPGWLDAVDVTLAAHSMYDLGEIGPFLDGMERHARRRCVALLQPQARGTALAALFEAVHGEPIATLPALREFVALIGARGRRYEVRVAPVEPVPAVTPHDAAIAEARRLLWLSEGSAKEQRMRALLEESWGRPDGIAMPHPPPHVGVVSWEPSAAPGAS